MVVCEEKKTMSGKREIIIFFIILLSSLYYFIGLYVKIKTVMLGVLLNKLAK